MPWFQRHNGSIVGECRHKSGGGVVEEFLPDNHPDVVAFRAGSPTADLSNLDNVAKRDKAILLAAAAMSGKTPAQAKAAYKAAFDAITEAVP